MGTSKTEPLLMNSPTKVVPEPKSSDQRSHVVIAVVSTNDARHIVGCLQSLAASTYQNFQVVICENGGLDAFENITRVLASLDFIERVNPDLGYELTIGQSKFMLGEGKQVIAVLNASQNLGYAGGVNACIAAVRNKPWDAVWVLNPDTFPESGALKALVLHQKKGNYGIVGSRLIFNSSGLVQTWGGMGWRVLLGRGLSIGLDQPAEMVPDIAEVERSLAFISGASMFVSRAYVEAIGVMDEDFFVYAEDVDWCLRRGPFKLGYAHDSVVRHINGGTSGAFSSSGSRFTVYLDARNRILLARKLFGSKWPLAATIYLAYPLYLFFRYKSGRQFRFALNGWWAGIRDERGAPYFIRQ
jgi:N-acetylglucosaminyl-diphospho-decaprenol L-rhamnosyltransferase